MKDMNKKGLHLSSRRPKKKKRRRSNVGQIVKEEGVKLTQNGMGKFFCLAGIGGHVSRVIESL
jgi:hypothetical protein